MTLLREPRWEHGNGCLSGVSSLSLIALPSFKDLLILRTLDFLAVPTPCSICTLDQTVSDSVKKPSRVHVCVYTFKDMRVYRHWRSSTYWEPCHEAVRPLPSVHNPHSLPIPSPIP